MGPVLAALAAGPEEDPGGTAVAVAQALRAAFPQAPAGAAVILPAEAHGRVIRSGWGDASGWPAPEAPAPVWREWWRRAGQAGRWTVTIRVGGEDRGGVCLAGADDLPEWGIAFLHAAAGHLRSAVAAARASECATAPQAELLQHLAAGLVHEQNNVLMGIEVQRELLGWQGHEPALRHLEAIARLVARGRETARALQALAERRPAVVSLPDLVARAMAYLRLLQDGRHLQIRLGSLPASPVELWPAEIALALAMLYLVRQVGRGWAGVISGGLTAGGETLVTICPAGAPPDLPAVVPAEAAAAVAADAGLTAARRLLRLRGGDLICSLGAGGPALGFLLPPPA